MNRKQWLKDNQWFIDAIANETPVSVSDDGRDWYGKKIATGFDLDDEREQYYITDFGYYKYAKPLHKTERRYLDPVEMMQWLVDHGYSPDDDGVWCGEEYIFTPAMWKYCGRTVSGPYSWHPDWIKEA